MTLNRQDLEALDDYLRTVRRAARLGREPAPDPDAIAVDAEPALWRRLAVTHASERLPAESYAEAAFGGLQDSTPRSGLLSLHARVDEVDPAAWEHPSLLQVWMRWSDYVVPRADAGVFTLGARPRDRRHATAIDRLTDAVLDVLVDGRRDGRQVSEALPELPNPALIRASAVSGRIHIRWDTRTTELIAATRPRMAAETARAELARRFLHWHGPAGPTHFAKWAGVSRDDAETTWRALASEIVPVALAGRRRWLLGSDLDHLLHAERPRGTRLLPHGDPCLYMADADPPSPTPPPPTLQPDPAVGRTSRLINSLVGRLVLDGEVVGAWGRAGRDVTIDPWPALPRRRRQEIEAAAHTLAGPIGAPIRIRWLERE